MWSIIRNRLYRTTRSRLVLVVSRMLWIIKHRRRSMETFRNHSQIRVREHRVMGKTYSKLLNPNLRHKRSPRMHTPWYRSRWGQNKPNSLKTSLSTRRRFWSSLIVTRYMTNSCRFSTNVKSFMHRWKATRSWAEMQQIRGSAWTLKLSQRRKVWSLFNALSFYQIHQPSLTPMLATVHRTACNKSQSNLYKPQRGQIVSNNMF